MLPTTRQGQRPAEQIMMELRKRRSLAGQTVLVTRPRDQAEALSSLLRALGARVLEVPTIRIVDPPDRGPLLEAAKRIADYDWLVFTSANGVRKFRLAAEQAGVPRHRLEKIHVASIGPATAEELEAWGVRSSVVPAAYRAEALVAAIESHARKADPTDSRPLAGARVLLPRASEARNVLPEGLRASGARVDVVSAYVTQVNVARREELRGVLESGRLDWVTFTSSSTVRSFVALAGHATGGARVAVIGPITEDTARKLGLRVDAVANSYTVAGLVQAIDNAACQEVGGQA